MQARERIGAGENRTLGRRACPVKKYLCTGKSAARSRAKLQNIRSYKPNPQANTKVLWTESVHWLSKKGTKWHWIHNGRFVLQFLGSTHGAGSPYTTVSTFVAEALVVMNTKAHTPRCMGDLSVKQNFRSQYTAVYLTRHNPHTPTHAHRERERERERERDTPAQIKSIMQKFVLNTVSGLASSAGLFLCRSYSSWSAVHHSK